jgi:hypothetical protein
VYFNMVRGTRGIRAGSRPVCLPAGMTRLGDMHHLVVFFGMFGFGAMHTATFSDMTLTQ